MIMLSLVDQTSAPRITFYDNALIERLTVTDRTVNSDGA
jgi:hypothetical protein